MAYWAKSYGAMPEPDRKIAARTMLRAVEREHDEMNRGNGKALKRFEQAGLTGFDLPILKDFLHDIATTGQVPS